MINQSIDKIPIVFFDLGNVIFSISSEFFIEDAIEKSMERYNKNHEDNKIKFNEEILAEILEFKNFLDSEDIKKVAILHDIVKIVQNSNFSFTVKEIMIDWLKNHTDSLPLMKGADKIFSKMKEFGFKIGIISDIFQESYDILEKKYEFLKESDFTILSGANDVNCRKPNDEIYIYGLKKAGIFDENTGKIYDYLSDRVFFIDDRKENLDAAVKFGIVPVFTNEWRRKYGQENDIFDILMNCEKLKFLTA